MMSLTMVFVCKIKNYRDFQETESFKSITVGLSTVEYHSIVGIKKDGLVQRTQKIIQEKMVLFPLAQLSNAS